MSFKVPSHQNPSMVLRLKKPIPAWLPVFGLLHLESNFISLSNFFSPDRRQRTIQQMQFSHLASSCSQGALILLQGAFFCPVEEEELFQETYRSSYMPLNMFVCFSPFKCQPQEMPRTCILLKPGVSPKSPSPTLPIPQPVLPGATAEPAGTSLPKDGLVWSSFPSILCTMLLFFLIRALCLLASQLFFFLF